MVLNFANMLYVTKIIKRQKKSFIITRNKALGMKQAYGMNGSALR